MSQDNVRCAKCNILCGYDDGKGQWDGKNLAICHECKENLIIRFMAFFGLNDYSADQSGLILEWPQVDNILSKIKKDYVMCNTYLTSDKDYYGHITRYK